jgi:hypothetical protein
MRHDSNWTAELHRAPALIHSGQVNAEFDHKRIER